MRIYHRGLMLSFALLLPALAHASFLAKLFYALRTTTTSAPAPKPKLPGQETRAFVLHKAHAQDLLIPLQNYLNGISKTGGSIQIRTTDNALIATDYPENLQRLEGLLPDIDHVYANPNAEARQLLATQSLMKAIQNHPDSTVTTRSSERFTPARATSAAPKAPVSVYGSAGSSAAPTRGVHSHDADEMGPVRVRRWTTNPTLAQFEMVGWMQDDQGYTVVLSNQGVRFLYRHGKLRDGYNLKAKPLEGIDGVIRDNQLILNDGQNHVSLKMMKWRSL